MGMGLKLRFRKPYWILLSLFAMVNVAAYNHAYQFTHFSDSSSARKKPEELSLVEKMKVLLCGIENPRPVNTTTPKPPFETIELQSYQRLEGWLIEKENAKGIVVLFHGYTGSKSGNLSYGTAFNRMGYSTLLMDFQGGGGSEGNRTTIGYKESLDVKRSLEYAAQRYPDQEVILFGSSMGAVAILRAVAEYHITPNKIILECPFGTMKATVRKRFEAMKIPSFPFAELLLFYGGLQNGFNAFQHNPILYAGKVNLPTLLMYGSKDQRVTEAEINAIYERLSGEKVLVSLPNSGHENYLINSEQDWLAGVQSFLSRF